MRHTAVAALAVWVWVIPPSQSGVPATRKPNVGVVQSKRASEAHPSTNPEDKRQNSTDDAYQRLISALAKNAEVQAEARKAEASAKTDEQNVQGHLVLYTGLLVAVGALQALILGGTIWAIYHQTVSSQNSERAWIVVVPDKWSPELAVMPKSGGQVPLNVFEAWVKNLGKTPAKIVGMATKYVKLEKMADLPTDPDYKDAYTLFGLLLVPQDSIGQRIPLKPTPTLSDEEARKINNAEMFLYAYGLIVYDDAFGKQRITRWGYVYNFPQGGLVSFFKPNFQRDGPKKYNEST